MKLYETQINFDDFPDSPYVRELRRGVSTRPFAPQIESAFRQMYLERVHLRARVCFTLSMLIGVALATLHVHEHGLYRIYDFGLVALLTVPAIAMLGIVWSPLYQGLFLKSGALATVVMCSTVLVIVENITVGGADATSGLAVNVFAIHFLAGLMLFSAVCTDAALLVVFVAAGAWFHAPLAPMINGGAILVLAVLVTAVVHRDVEVSYRRTFLENALIRAMASRDGLTGVANRRALDEHLRRIWQQALRDRRQVALLLIDIDYFKEFNDRHGHQAGDTALREVAQVIDGFARRPFDLAARYGGEEFTVVLYDVAAAWVPVVCEQMRQSVATLHERWSLRNCAPLTISIGAGIVEPSLNRTLQGAVQFADEALYAAKQQGRNCVAVRGGDEYRTFRTGTFNNAFVLK